MQDKATISGPWSDKGLEMLNGLGFAPKHILDIGANVGDWTREHMRLYPDAKFIMVDGSNHSDKWTDLLKTNRVDAEIAILDSAVHEVTWFGVGGTGDSFHKEQSAKFSNVAGKTRRTQMLDILVSNKGWNESIDILKLDVQGAELDVLKGAGHVLKRTKVVTMELPVAGSYNANTPSFAEYIKFMDQAGFRPWDVAEFHRVNKDHKITGNDGFLFQIDFAFLRKNSQYWNAVQDAIAGVKGR